ncbi:hypothetical protein B0T10DRAFT_606714 [Thelonectria olida]|uniref:Heterokaryon incompatibility domain-containing protein n=1 Tax=Thelonectria olida TaxID=1576542 RepID=A0A9P9AQ98_9HYPO|nr:hypothetical protein B0T10DRAFT_606714 [Thelonectria olida]
MSALEPLPRNDGDPGHYTVDEQTIECPPYCDDCRNMVKSWPWEQVQHQAVGAMEHESCPLCKFIFNTLALKDRTVPWEYGGLIQLHSWADEGDPHSDITPLRRPITDIASPASIKAARDWLEACSNNHPNCRAQFGDFLSGPSPLPHRILQLGARDGYVRIHQSTPEEKGVYATLAYRWGGRAQTVEATTKMMKKSKFENDGGPWIKVASLPQALQDAVELTRGLKIKFLWVDVLCTLQDDAADGEKTRNNFLGIHKNAAVCIRAANIDSVDKSFLRNKGPYKPVPACVVHITKGGGGDITLKFTTKSNAAWNGMCRFNGSHMDRSWTIAECFVSPRQLTITAHNEMTFHCIQPQTSLSKALTWATTINESFTQHHYQGKFGLAWLTHHKLAVDHLHRQWRMLVSDIQRNEAYRREDRPAILFSIAQDPLWEGEFMYGFWKEHARDLLIWEVVYRGVEDDRCRRLAQAPTWSWASTSAKTDYQHVEYMMNWQFRFVDWVRGSSHGLRPFLPSGLATVILKGKVVPRAHFQRKCGPAQLFLHSYEVDCNETWSEADEGGLFYLLLGQLYFGQYDNTLAAATNGTTAKATVEDVQTAFKDEAHVLVDSKASTSENPLPNTEPAAQEITPRLSQEAMEDTTQTQTGYADAVPAANPGFGPSKPIHENESQGQDTKPKSGRFSAFIEEFPREFGRRRNPVLALMQRFPRPTSKSGPSTLFAARALDPEKHTKMMVLRHVSGKTFERVALVTRTCQPNWVAFWNSVGVQEVHLV